MSNNKSDKTKNSISCNNICLWIFLLLNSAVTIYLLQKNSELIGQVIQLQKLSISGNSGSVDIQLKQKIDFLMQDVQVLYSYMEKQTQKISQTGKNDQQIEEPNQNKNKNKRSKQQNKQNKNENIGQLFTKIFVSVKDQVKEQIIQIDNTYKVEDKIKYATQQGIKQAQYGINNVKQWFKKLSK